MPTSSPLPPTVERGDGRITVGGLWTYEWGAKRRPFVHPVATPSGRVLTREAPDDHPWHHALWFAIKYVDGDNFWEEMPPYGVVRHDGEPDVIEGNAGELTLAGSLTWTRPDRETVALSEHRTLTHVPLADGAAYAIDLDTTLIPHADVRLERTEFTTWGGYGGLTFRGRDDFTDTRFLLADGSAHDRIEGVPSAWCDLTGTVDGATAGIALFDHPANRRHPTPFYGSVRSPNYGDGWSNFFNAAFLFHEGMDVAAGEKLRIRHRVVVHDGEWSIAELSDSWATWAGAT